VGVGAKVLVGRIFVGVKVAVALGSGLTDGTTVGTLLTSLQEARTIQNIIEMKSNFFIILL